MFSMGELGDEYFLRYGAAPSRLYRVPNEPDYAAIEGVTEASVSRFRASCGLSSDRRYILFVGRLIGLKRIDLLIESDLSIAGYCMGGLLSVMYAALNADGPLRNLACFTTPIDFDGMGLFKRWTDPDHFDVDRSVDARLELGAP